MESPTPRSPRTRSHLGGRRSARPPSHLHSDCPPDPPDDPNDSPSMGKRSVSLTTLQPTIIQPRMAQLETLEAKMASIEVSLSSTPRRRKNGAANGLSLGSCIRAVPKEIAVKELETLRNALRDKENIIQSLKGRLTVPGVRLANVRNNGVCNNNNNNQANRELSDVEKKQAEERLNRLKIDTDNKRLTIKNLKMALERLDITDNIDVRIQQAELEYQLGREELNLLTLLEETRALQLCLEESNKNSADCHTLYSCLKDNKNLSLVATEVTYDPKSPKFGASSKDSTPGLWIDWALEETGLVKDDRLLEVNGKIVLTKSREDLTRLLSAAPDPAQIVVLRKIEEIQNVSSNTPPPNNTTGEVAALRNELDVVRDQAEEAQKAKDGLRADNVRLTHRISYLEEQVSELLSRKPSENDPPPPSLVTSVKSNQNVTNINITSKPTTIPPPNGPSNNDLQVFQKGPQVTALVANLPGLDVSKDSHTALPVRSRSSMSNVSNTHIPAPTSESHSCHKSHRQKHRSSSKNHAYESNGESRIAYKKHQHQHQHQHQCSNREKDYSSETNSTAASEQILRQNKKNAMENGYHRQSYSNSEKEYQSEISLMDQSFKKATKIVHELTRHKDNNSLYEKHRQKCITASEKYNTDLLKHYNVRKSTSVMDFRSSEVHIKSKYSDSKSVEELDAIDDSRSKNPGRLPESRSVKSLDFDSDTNNSVTMINGTSKSIDYASEPSDHHRKLTYDGYKPRPTPPKKPIRLSLHKNQNGSLETSSVVSNGSSVKSDYRKPLKRNHKGEMPPVSVTVKIEGHPEHNGNGYSSVDNLGIRTSKEGTLMPMKWSSFSQLK